MSKFEIQLSGDGVEKSSDGHYLIYKYTHGERVFRCLKFFTLFFVLAIASAFVPFLHFILVPLFVLLALLFGYFSYFDKENIIQAEGQCPYCLKTTSIARASMTLPFTDLCVNCRQVMTVQVRG
jgi:hypothetical protein